MRLAVLSLVLATACTKPPPVAPSRAIPEPLARSTPDGELRKKMPPAAPATPWVPPEAEERKLSNGVRVWIYERHDFPTAVLRIVSDRGSDHASFETAQVWSRSIMHQAPGLSPWQVRDEAARLGIAPSLGADRDWTAIDVEVLSKLFAPTADLLGALVCGPLVSNADVKAAQKLAAATVGSAGLLSRAMQHAMYPAQHPYAGTDGVGKIAYVSAEEVLEYHRRVFAPEHTIIIVVGDVEAAEAQTTLERAFGRLSGQPSNAPKIAPVPPPKGPKFVVVNRPLARQSQIAAMWLGPTIGSEDEAPLAIVRERVREELWNDVRVGKGATYGLRVQTPIGRVPRILSIEGEVETERTVEAIRDIIGDVAAVANDPWTTEMLAYERLAAASAIPQLFEDMPSTAAALTRIAARGAKLSYYANLQKQLAGITAEDVMRAARTWMPVDATRFVIVGDARALRKPLEQLGLGEVQVVEPE